MNIAAKHIVNKGTFSAGTDMTIVQQISRSTALTEVADELTRTTISPNLINVRNLIINANKGTFSALNGAINIDTQNHLKPNRINLVKGEYLSQTFVVDAGLGTIHLHADKVSGLATLTAGDIKFGPKNKVSFSGTITLEDGDESAPPSKKRAKRQIAKQTESESTSHFKAVSFVQPTLKLLDRELPSCNALIAPRFRDAVASAGSVRIHVSKGSAAFVINSGAQVSVMSLHDDKTGDVSVLAGGQEIKLRAGEQVVIGYQNEQDTESEPMPSIGVRSVDRHNLSDGLRATVSEFSIPSAVLEVQSLKALKSSSEMHERQLFAKMLKNAAVIQTVGIRKGAYKTM
jgi:hypothetical protein